MIIGARGHQGSVSLAGLGDCMPLGYQLGGKDMCRDNATGSIVDCAAAGCKSVGSPGGVAAPYQQFGTACTPKQYTFLDPAPWPPKDPCIIKNLVSCLPADWPAPGSGYYDSNPGVPVCSGPLSPFGTPITPTPGNTLNNVAPPAYTPPAPAPQGNALTPPAGSPALPGAPINNTNTGNPVLGTRPGDTEETPNAVTEWVKDNWVLLAVGAGALLILPRMMGGKH